MFIENYNGYAIWATTPACKTFYLAGPGARVTQLFRSVANAKKHADFLIKYVVKHGQNRFQQIRTDNTMAYHCPASVSRYIGLRVYSFGVLRVMTNIIDKEEPAVVLLLDDNRGIYIPQDFCGMFDISDWQINDADAAICIAGPDHGFYWDAWNDILNSAQHIKHGHRLYQDGTLFALNYERMTCEEHRNFGNDDHRNCEGVRQAE